MIKSAIQLKAKVRNYSGGDDRVSKALIRCYNIETLLAEKSQTIISRGLANTRMRDFYDIYEIVKQKDFSQELYKEAFIATCRKRETEFTYEKIEYELSNISTSNEMRNMWIRFKEKNYFVEDIEYDEMMAQICSIILSILKK